MRGRRADAAYRNHAVNYSIAIAGGTCATSSVIATRIARPTPERVEAAICPSPHSTLPISSNSELSCLPLIQRKALHTWARTSLRCYRWVYNLGALVCDCQWPHLVSLADILVRSPLHVMKSVDGIKGADKNQ